MKIKTLLLLMSCFSCLITLSQDIVLKSNCEEIKSKDFEFQSNSNVDVSIFQKPMIAYSCVVREIYSNTEAELNNHSNDKVSNRLTNKRYFLIGAGVGNSYGTYGIKMQYVSSGNTRFGIHGGVGYYDTLGGWILYSAGVQLYYWNNLYVDVQFGSFGAYSESNGYYSKYSSDSGLFYGPSLLLGYDWYITDHIGLNVAAGLSRKLNHNNDYLMAADLGILFKF